jgi:hypothetical protein
MELLKPKPAYVTFETRAEEDREASIRDGCARFKDVDFACITPSGSRDRIERKVDEWLPQLDYQVKQSLLPAEWAQVYKGAYENFKQGREAPVIGTDLRNWPNVTPSQLKVLRELQVRTIEDLAVANEETLHRIGMGARALKEKAIEYLSLASGHGRTVEEIVAIKVENEALKTQVAAQSEQMKELRATLANLEAAMARFAGGRQIPEGAVPTAEDLLT